MTIKAIKVRAFKDGYRRANRAWSKDETTVATSEFTKDQLAALKADQNLVIVDTEMDGDESAPAKKTKAGAT